MRTCVDDNGLDAIGVFDNQEPRCIRKLCLSSAVSTAFSSILLYDYNTMLNAIYPAIECSPLPAITNGFITYAPDDTPNYNLGTVATYECDTGFVLDLSLGGSMTRTCVDDNGLDAIGVFNTQAPRCIRKLYLRLIADTL